MSRLLDVEGIDAGYGRSRVLFGASLHVDEGESIALVGRNGMGKTTTIRTILGLCRASAGRVTFAGTDETNAPPYRIARHGIGLVPEGREVFPTLTVRENLTATAANHGRLANPWTLAEVFALFPRLAERTDALGSQLSGGEQQMLAIGRATARPASRDLGRSDRRARPDRARGDLVRAAPPTRTRPIGACRRQAPRRADNALRPRRRDRKRPHRMGRRARHARLRP